MWMLAVALLAGLAAATLLYFRNKKQHYSKALNAILFALRTLMVGLVVLLLFNLNSQLPRFQEQLWHRR